MTDRDDDRLATEPFSYREVASGKVFIAYEGRDVTVLAGKQATAFLRKVAGLDARGRQLVMAKATGNFKRGNERSGKER
ncbi:MAG: hypothetical protein R3C71_05185 [Candidatus Krumholzibacteriia bacterium]